MHWLWCGSSALSLSGPVSCLSDRHCRERNGLPLPRQRVSVRDGPDTEGCYGDGSSRPDIPGTQLVVSEALLTCETCFMFDVVTGLSDACIGLFYCLNDGGVEGLWSRLLLLIPTVKN